LPPIFSFVRFQLKKCRKKRLRRRAPNSDAIDFRRHHRSFKRQYSNTRSAKRRRCSNFKFRSIRYGASHARQRRLAANRDWRGVYELSAAPFIANRQQAVTDPHLLGEWAAEAAKRFGVPALALAHTLLALALGLTFGNITGRRGAGGGLLNMAAANSPYYLSCLT
jgi:hypothetical protein